MANLTPSKELHNSAMSEGAHGYEESPIDAATQAEIQKLLEHIDSLDTESRGQLVQESGDGEGDELHQDETSQKRRNDDRTSQGRVQKPARGRSKMTKLRPSSKRLPKETEHKLSSLMGSNIFNDAQLAQSMSLQPVWKETTRKGDAIAHLIKEGNTTDANWLDAALKKFGTKKTKPGINGEWTVMGMNTQLQSHQIVGTAFMIGRERQADQPTSGGILADQMGMGKTVMVLALIMNDLVTRATSPPGPTLIIVPATILHQWEQEIAKHCDLDNCKYMVFRERIAKHQEDIVAYIYKRDIILTTFNEVANSYPTLEVPEELMEPIARQDWWNERFQQQKGSLHRVQWHRVVVDEAHEMRNWKSKRYRSIASLNRGFSWCLTGSPLINDAGDLFSLLEFIRYKHDYSYSTFQRTFNRPDDDAERIWAQILSQCFLRRTLASTFLNAKLIDLPKATSDVIRIDFSKVEREIYDIVEARFGKRAQILARSGQLSHVFTLLLRLRQLTSHPLCLDLDIVDMLDRPDLERLQEVATQDTRGLNKAAHDLLARLKEMLRHKNTMEKDMKKRDMQLEHADDGAATGTWSKQDGYGTKARFEKYIHGLLISDTKKELEHAKKCVFCNASPASDPYVTDCLHIYCHECLRELQYDAAEEGNASTQCKKCHQIFETAEPCTDSLARIATGRCTKSCKSNKVILKENCQEWFGVKSEFLASSKTIAVRAQIDNIFEREADAKIIIFTQWLMMLQILESMCTMQEWPNVIYDGTMSLGARNKAVQTFHDHRGRCIMLCSLKAAGLGLNLNCANHVINIDQWWNNAVEDQAFSRVYRFGQKKETFRLQIVINNSIDDRLEHIKKMKQDNIDQIQGRDDDETCLRKTLTAKELLSLFGIDEFVSDEKVMHDDRGGVEEGDAGMAEKTG